jgi:hypothetical protein
MDLLFTFISLQCQKYNIDESHGLKHAQGTLVRAYDILQKLDAVTKEEMRMALYAAALHDMCDSKYTDTSRASEDIRVFLLGQMWSAEDAAALIHIVTTMSYTKLKSIGVFPDHGKWQRVYHTVRHADLLEGYIVARCILYNKHMYPDKTEDEHWQRAGQLFRDRVFTYTTDGWIFFPEAIQMVDSLYVEAIRCLSEKSMNWPEPPITKIKIDFGDV